MTVARLGLIRAESAKYGIFNPHNAFIVHDRVAIRVSGARKGVVPALVADKVDPVPKTVISLFSSRTCREAYVCAHRRVG